jgi:hypothetical protein
MKLDGYQYKYKMAGKIIHEILWSVRQWQVPTPIADDTIINFGDATDFFGDSNKTF